jgi:AcrR family transcriptional regulator
VVVIRRPPGLDYSGGPGDDRQATRMAIRRAAMGLFEQNGYAGTSLDDIVREAGIARRSFFHYFSGKHEIISSDHRVYLAEISAYLDRYSAEPTISRAASALCLVIDSFLVVPEESRNRYSLSRGIPMLRAEELSWVASYQEAIAAFLRTGLSNDEEMRADIIAAALVAAATKSLRRWLRGSDGADPVTEFSRASDLIEDWYRSGGTHVNRIVIVDTVLDVDEVIRRLES